MSCERSSFFVGGRNAMNHMNQNDRYKYWNTLFSNSLLLGFTFVSLICLLTVAGLVPLPPVGSLAYQSCHSALVAMPASFGLIVHLQAALVCFGMFRLCPFICLAAVLAEVVLSRTFGHLCLPLWFSMLRFTFASRSGWCPCFGVFLVEFLPLCQPVG